MYKSIPKKRRGGNATSAADAAAATAARLEALLTPATEEGEIPTGPSSRPIITIAVPDAAGKYNTTKYQTTGFDRVNHTFTATIGTLPINFISLAADPRFKALGAQSFAIDFLRHDLTDGPEYQAILHKASHSAIIASAKYSHNNIPDDNNEGAYTTLAEDFLPSHSDGCRLLDGACIHLLQEEKDKPPIIIQVTGIVTDTEETTVLARRLQQCYNQERPAIAAVHTTSAQFLTNIDSIKTLLDKNPTNVLQVPTIGQFRNTLLSIAQPIESNKISSDNLDGAGPEQIGIAIEPFPPAKGWKVKVLTGHLAEQIFLVRNEKDYTKEFERNPIGAAGDRIVFIPTPPPPSKLSPEEAKKHKPDQPLNGAKYARVLPRIQCTL